LKLETFLFDLDLPPRDRELSFSLHVLPGSLVSRLQIGIVEKLSTGTIEVFNIAGDHPNLVGRTGHRYGQGGRNQYSS
jgi:hypothetical protein